MKPLYNTTCKNCSSPSLYLYANLTPKIFGGNSYQIALCRTCGVGATIPVPCSSIAHYIESDRPEIISKLIKRLMKDEILRMMKEYRRLFGRMPRSILDVGCGNGLFLMVAQELGLQAHGIEPSTAMSEAARAKGTMVMQSSIQDFTGYEQYDLVTLNSVTEHLSSPKEAIQLLAERVRDKTLICFQQAVFDGLIPRILKTVWYGWSPEEHYWHFSESSFQKLIQKNGLIVAKASRTNLYYQWVPLEKIWHWKSFLFSNTQKLLSLVAYLLQQGDSITFYATKAKIQDARK